MNDLTKWAREWVERNAKRNGALETPLDFLITAARREGAEDMRERAAEYHEEMARRYDGVGSRTDAAAHREHARRIRALPLPGDE